MPTPEVKLRNTASADLPAVLAAERHPEARDLVHQWSEAQHAAALTAPDIAHLVVEGATSGEVLGYAIVAGRLDRHNVELRRLVITLKNRGHGQAALRAIMRKVFVEWHAHRLWLDVRPENARALHLYRKAGFTVEGVMRECLAEGPPHGSLVLMSILAPECLLPEVGEALGKQRG